MNTHDIELPPLPNLIPVDHAGKQQAMMDYARAAIEADRKRRGEPVRCQCCGYLATDREHLSCVRAAQPAEPSRGEPVAWEHRFRALPDGPWAAWGPGKAPDLRTDKYEVQERALYAAPQPVEPTIEQSLIVAEPVKVPSDDDLEVLAYEYCDETGAGGETPRFIGTQSLKAFVHALLARCGAQPPASAEPSVPDTIYLGCARMGMAGASDEEVLRYVRAAKESAAQEPLRSD